MAASDIWVVVWFLLSYQPRDPEPVARPNCVSIPHNNSYPMRLLGRNFGTRQSAKHIIGVSCYLPPCTLICFLSINFRLAWSEFHLAPSVSHQVNQHLLYTEGRYLNPVLNFIMKIGLFSTQGNEHAEVPSVLRITIIPAIFCLIWLFLCSHHVFSEALWYFCKLLPPFCAWASQASSMILWRCQKKGCTQVFWLYTCHATVWIG